MITAGFANYIANNSSRFDIIEEREYRQALILLEDLILLQAYNGYKYAVWLYSDYKPATRDKVIQTLRDWGFDIKNRSAISEAVVRW